MKQIPAKALSFALGLAVAAVLFTAMWIVVGRSYVDPAFVDRFARESILVELFWGPLMPAMLATAFAAGAAMNVVRQRAGLAWGLLRGPLLAYLFALIAYPMSYKAAINGSRRGLSSVNADWTNLLIMFLIGAFPFMVAALAGSIVGHVLLGRSRKSACRLAAGSGVIALAMVFVQYVLILATAAAFAKVAAPRSAEIRQNLCSAFSVSGWRYHASGLFPPRIDKIRREVTDGVITAEFNPGCSLRTVQLDLMAPKGVSIGSEASARRFLKEHGVPDLMLKRLQPCGWSSYRTASYRNFHLFLYSFKEQTEDSDSCD